MFDTIRRTVREDVRTAKENDPAARSTAEVLLYAGLHAVWLYRLAHAIHERGHPLFARAFSQFTRWVTGVEIHPAASIGRRLFVDHGMGVVVGETAEIGDDVVLYHGVTLGGRSMRREKRHPTLGDDVTVGANATLLGPITVGDGATVGAGAVVTKDVPAGATVVGNPARRVDGGAEGSADDGGSSGRSGREADEGSAICATANGGDTDTDSGSGTDADGDPDSDADPASDTDPASDSDSDSDADSDPPAGAARGSDPAA